jgi:hypothetical protein
MYNYVVISTLVIGIILFLYGLIEWIFKHQKASGVAYIVVAFLLVGVGLYLKQKIIRFD